VSGRVVIASAATSPYSDADGHSRISIEDAAVALIDEAELPRFIQRRFTAGY